MNEPIDKIDKIDKIISLLKRYPEQRIAATLLETILGDEEVRYGASTIIPLEHSLDVYKTRSQINTKLNGGGIKGYETLIPALENAGVEKVQIQSFELLGKWYIVFTDDAVSVLFGILDCPKKKVNWFNPETGYD